MSDAEMRLLVESFIKALDAFKTSLDKHSEAIREYAITTQATKQPENPPEPPKIIAELPEGITRYYDSEYQERKSTKRWKWVERGLAVAAGTIAAILAVLTNSTLQQVKRQADAAQEQTRPWIKIVDVTIAESSEQFPALNFQTWPWPTPADPSGKNTQKLVAIISLEITVKNIGKGVARDVFISPILMFEKFNTTKILANDEQEVCSQTTKWNPGVPFVWSSMFPDDVRHSRIMTTGFYDREMLYHPTGRAGDWISGIVFGCVSYQSSLGYRTEGIFDVMGEKDRFVEVGKKLISTNQVHLLRDEHYEYAQ